MFRFRLTYAALFLILFDIAVTQRLIEHKYNCRRNGYRCKENGRCRNGECICPAGLTGYDCGIKQVDVNCDTNHCSNGGICYVVNGNPTCYCPVTHYGATCEELTDSFECLGTEMKVKLMLPSGFGGSVYGYTGNGNDRTNCAFTVEKSLVEGYFEATQAILFDNSSCGATPSTDVPNKGDVTYTASMVVGFHSMFQVKEDRLITLNCTHPANNVSTEADVNSNINERGNLTKNEDKKMYHPVKFTFLDKGGDVLRKSLFVGEEFSNMVYLVSTDVYTSLLLDRCIATDGDPVDAKEIVLLENGCPTLDGTPVMQDPPGQRKTTYLPEGFTEAVPAAALDMFGFRFYSKSNQVFISCVVRICKELDVALCEIPPECDNSLVATPAAPLSRRKRDADKKDKNTAEQTVSSVFTVKNRGANFEQQKAPSDITDCFRSREIVVVIIVMSALVLIMLIACACLACLIIRSRGRVRKILGENNGQGFHIPRAKIAT